MQFNQQMTEELYPVTYIGRCSVTHKMMEGKDAYLDEYDQMYRCYCHHQPILSTKSVDIIRKGEDGWYWVRSGP